MKIYLAARYSRREELCQYREALKSLGHEVTSRWLNGNHQAENDELDKGAAAELFASEDLDDVIESQLVISFTETPRTTQSRGGRHVEFGVAIGRGIPVWVVGPRENVFHCLGHVDQFDSWDKAFTAIESQG